MQSLQLEPEILALLQADGILRVTAGRSLSVQDVDLLLLSDAIRCVTMSAIHKGPRWLAPSERNRLWQEEIRPRMVNPSWEGAYQASEWHTDQNEQIVVFVHFYAPI